MNSIKLIRYEQLTVGESSSVWHFTSFPSSICYQILFSRAQILRFSLIVKHKYLSVEYGYVEAKDSRMVFWVAAER